MKANYRKAFNALKKMGVPVYVHVDAPKHFDISAEDPNSDEFVNYFDGYLFDDWVFGVCPQVYEVLRKNGLFAEWVNPAHLRVFEG